MKTTASPHVDRGYPSVKCVDGVVHPIQGLKLLTEFISSIFSLEYRDHTGETDIRFLVGRVLRVCAKGLNGGQLLDVPMMVQHEAALSHLFPDIVILKSGTHVGICEVKKPSTADVNVFKADGVLGQVFSYLRLLRTYCGIRYYHIDSFLEFDDSQKRLNPWYCRSCRSFQFAEQYDRIGFIQFVVVARKRVVVVQRIYDHQRRWKRMACCIAHCKQSDWQVVHLSIAGQCTEKQVYDPYRAGSHPNVLLVCTGSRFDVPRWVVCLPRLL